ncbi:hypothetical protein SEUCBS139899_004803 [Sporothrix eucalyptigena]|uniref:Translation initiation factor IF-3 n=1 Tax=Sporothrix eucalyptigena TaxID=1812306 RepID=A0ABP0BHL9_9PEZI
MSAGRKQQLQRSQQRRPPPRRPPAGHVAWPSGGASRSPSQGQGQAHAQGVRDPRQRAFPSRPPPSNNFGPGRSDTSGGGGGYGNRPIRRQSEPSGPRPQTRNEDGAASIRWTEERVDVAKLVEFAKSPKGQKLRLPRGRNIFHSHVLLVSPDGLLSEPRPTNVVLRGVNRILESLEVLAMPNPDQFGPSHPRGRFPICHIVNVIEERKREGDRLAAERKKTVAKKELELNWAIDLHDLEHRLKKLREFLAKGLLVDIALTNKKRGRKATDQEAREVIRRIREAIAEVPGSKERKAMEGEILRSAKICVQGASVKKKAADGDK